jgi:LPS-assembly lipoprotein
MKFITLFALLFLTACGFTPVYGTKTVSNDLSNIDIAIIPDEEGQIVRNHLIDAMYNDGYPSNPQYRLVVSPVQESIVEIGIDRDDEASRAQLRQETTMRLIDLDDKVVLQRKVRATSGYNILAGQFTTFVTEEDARKQALKALSNNIITQLELYFNR